jgi:hypothetical protein
MNTAPNTLKLRPPEVCDNDNTQWPTVCGVSQKKSLQIQIQKIRDGSAVGIFTRAMEVYWDGFSQTLVKLIKKDPAHCFQNSTFRLFPEGVVISRRWRTDLDIWTPYCHYTMLGFDQLRHLLEQQRESCIFYGLLAREDVYKEYRLQVNCLLDERFVHPLSGIIDQYLDLP